MSDAILFRGLPVVATLMVSEFCEGIGQERKWAHRVMWRRAQRYKVIRNRVFLNMNGVLYAHPNTVEYLKQDVPAMGASR